MARILLIETSTALCSAALAENEVIRSYKESSAPKAHASLTAVFVSDILAENNISLKDCDAVCVSMGPGSYTGLRVGVSTAKGLCFGSGLPLLAVGTLDTLVAQAIKEDIIPEGCRYIIPMIDARRMEVYTAKFSMDAAAEECRWMQISETAPAIIDESSFAECLDEGPVLFIGDGAGKCADVIKHPNAHFCQCNPKASSMPIPALKAYNEKRFEDVAYFEPFYLKEFVATVSKKKLF
ncbi:MAG: tRNA (adenosine(37)-N6)-threonylcarbamoyltransferase complex dimerization subunit type 1 TsaB [Bacteroidales bacterium]|nr:tRNA (adenosine(37)-N6)-threonylcarbamoyltransferase complex dimerization subunit type 1 TsaB [Bacteroidales bacterium]